MAHHLVQIIAKPYQLSVGHVHGVIAGVLFRRNLRVGSSSNARPNEPGACRPQGARCDAGQLACGETELSCLSRGSDFLGRPMMASYGRAHASRGLGSSTDPQRETFALGKGTSRYPLPPIYLSDSLTSIETLCIRKH